MIKYIICFLCLLGFQTLTAYASPASFNSQDVNVRLQTMQTQLNQQTKEIQQLKKKIAKKNISSKKSDVSSTQFKQVKFDFYGQINPAFMYSDDGNGTNGYFVTNNASPSRVGGFATLQINSRLKIGANVEVGLLANPSDGMSQEQSASDSLNLRKVEVFLKSDQWGNLWLGKGQVSGDGAQYVDLSGTTVAGYSGVSDIGGGLLFYNKGTGSLSTISISNVFNYLNTHWRENRVRYDTPLWKSFYLSVTAMQDSNEDVALRYDHKFQPLELAGALSWTSPQNINSVPNVVHGQVLNGSLSGLLKCGVSGTFSVGQLFSKTAGRNDPHFWYGKLGYQHRWFSPGKTFLSVDYGKYSKYLQNNDEGKTYGADIVQGIDKWNLSCYAGYRHFKLDRPGSSFGNIDTFITGVLFKF